MTLRFDRTNGSTVDLESPFLGENLWGGPEESLAAETVNPIANEAESPFLASEWEDEADDYRGEHELEEEAFFEAEDEVHVCRECGHPREVGTLFFEAVEPSLAMESERAIQDQYALDAELGIGETPSEEAFLFEASDVPADISAYARTLGDEWSKRRGGKESPQAMSEWLVRDYRDTMQGARQRWSKFGKAPYTVEKIGRAWMVSRRENMLFQLGSPGVKALGTFGPPAQAVSLITSKLIGGSDVAPVAPITERFVKELRARWTGFMSASTYRGHGGGKFDSRGYSLDLFLKETDDRGFYDPNEAIRYLRAVHDAATAPGLQWRVIYNDFGVADAVNRALGREHVIFVGKVRKTGNKVSGLNWHGPAPLILHFHIDIAPLSGSASTWSGATPSASSSTGLLQSPLPGPTPTPSGPPTADVVRFAQRVLNAAERERLGVDGDMGKLTRAALERFSKRYGLRSSALDTTMELALAQRVLEGLAQMSMFAQYGVRDAATDQEVINFKLGRGLAGTPTIDAQTRAALADAIERRSTSTSPAVPSTTTPTPSGGGIDRDTVARIQQYKEGIERNAAQFGVSPHVMRGMIAAESDGKPNVGAGGSGYKGLMQADTSADQLEPEASLRRGAEKLRAFAASMRKYFRDTLKQDFDALPENTRVRITAAAYNAGPGSVKRAMRYAAAAGDVTRWLLPEHYVRSLMSYGAYSTRPSVIEWCVKKGHLTVDDLAADLARLTSKSVDDVRRTHGANAKALATALRSQLGAEAKRIKNDGSATLADMRARSSKSLYCAANFKWAHTEGYLGKIVRYKEYFESSA